MSAEAKYRKGDIVLWRVASVDDGVKMLVAEYPVAGNPDEIRLIDKNGNQARFFKRPGSETFPLLRRTTAHRPPELVDEIERAAAERFAERAGIARQQTA